MTSRQMILTVAWREFFERARDKSFAISTATTVAIVLGVVLLPRFLGFGGPSEYTVGVVGEAAALSDVAAQTAPLFDIALTMEPIANVGAARDAVAAGDVDVALLPDGVLLAEAQPAFSLESLLSQIWRQAQVEQGLVEAGVGSQDMQRLLNPPPLELRLLDAEADRGALQTVAFLGMVILYGQLFGYGMWVSMGIVEEKATRIVEVLLAAIRPGHLLAGKVLGIGALALLQLLLIAALGLGAVALTGLVELPPGTIAQVGQVLLWFLLGYTFYACAFAVAGAITPRQEELQNTITPLTMLILISFFLSFAALNDPSSLIARVASLLPMSAPLAMPIRVAAGVVPAWEIAAAIALTLGAGLALIPLAARIYSGAVLRTGSKVKLREAWRAARA